MAEIWQQTILFYCRWICCIFFILCYQNRKLNYCISGNILYLGRRSSHCKPEMTCALIKKNKQLRLFFFFSSGCQAFCCHIMYLDAFVNMHLSWTMRCAYKYVYILLGIFSLPMLAWYFIIFPTKKKILLLYSYELGRSGAVVVKVVNITTKQPWNICCSNVFSVCFW